MIGSNGVGNIFHQNGLTCLGLCHDECTLAFADGREEVYYACGEVGGGWVATKVIFLFGEEWGEMLERYPVAYFSRLAPINLVDAGEREIFLSIVGRTNVAFHHIAGFQSILLDLNGRHIHVVGRGEVVVVAGTKETISVGHDFEHAVAHNEVVEIVSGTLLTLLLWGKAHIGLLGHWRGGVVEHVVVGDGRMVFYRQVDYGDEVGAVTGVAFPNAVHQSLGLFFLGFVVCVDLGLQLCQEVRHVFIGLLGLGLVVGSH